MFYMREQQVQSLILMDGLKNTCKSQICSWNIDHCWVCRCRCSVTPVDSVDRKLDLLVDELEC